MLIVRYSKKEVSTSRKAVSFARAAFLFPTKNGLALPGRWAKALL